MDSEVDTSILNSVNIKRFTKTVLEEYGAEIDRSNRAKWEVEFPAELSAHLDREQGTLVFDAADRELGAGDLLVQPGTTVFSALLDLVQQSGTIGTLRLAEDSLQVNPPTVLQESELAVEATNFTGRTSDCALTFHFRVQFETPASFHSEEMFSVTIDPETKTRLPELTDRLTSHLPQLLEQNSEHSSPDVPETQVQQSFEEAQQAVIDRSRPIVSELQEEAVESAHERVKEISEWYERRREELDEQLEEQRKEIRKWNEKRRNARKDSTRRKYIKNRKEAQRDYDELQKEIKRKKRELDDEENEEIDDVIDRNQIDVDVSLLGVTEVVYVRGTLELEIGSDQTSTNIELTYLPATDKFRGLDCDVCSRDLTEGILPRVCNNGHLVGDPCATSCRNCDLTFCDDCEEATQFTTCFVCDESVCSNCTQGCDSCGSVVCSDHNEFCSSCNSSTCHLCGQPCATCGIFHCDSHLSHCQDCGDYHCKDHLQSCASCGSTRCLDDIDQCTECNDWLCTDHSGYCSTCGDTLCEEHIQFCATCTDEQESQTQAFCLDHTIRCSIDGEPVCSTHRNPRVLGSGYIRHSHLKSCDSCGISYGVDVLDDGQCTACQSLGRVEEENIPPDLVSEFRSTEAGMNDAYIVILGKKLLGRNKVIIYDRRSGEEVERKSAGMLKQLLGGYK